jgi:hypothetical protein
MFLLTNIQVRFKSFYIITTYRVALGKFRNISLEKWICTYDLYMNNGFVVLNLKAV